MKSSLIAIDPGASGGIAWVDQDGNAQCQPMPATEGDILETLQTFRCNGGRIAFLEEVGGFVGGPGQPGSLMFNFGRNFGFLLGALMAFGFRVEFCKPQRWQKHFNLGTARSAGSKSAWKNKLKAEAQRRFPACSVTLKTADALLILDYADHLINKPSKRNL